MGGGGGYRRHLVFLTFSTTCVRCVRVFLVYSPIKYLYEQLAYPPRPRPIPADVIKGVYRRHWITLLSNKKTNDSPWRSRHRARLDQREKEREIFLSINAPIVVNTTIYRTIFFSTLVSFSPLISSWPIPPARTTRSRTRSFPAGS